MQRVVGDEILVHFREHTCQHSVDVAVLAVVEPHAKVGSVSPTLICSRCSKPDNRMVRCDQKWSSFPSATLVTVQHQGAATRNVNIVLVELSPKPTVWIGNFVPLPKLT